MTLRYLIVICFSFVLVLIAQPASASDYDSFKVGKLEGRLIVQWIEPDVFVFLPDKQKPLTFIRSDGTRITPGHMLTDGGSIPRALWILRNYSPWGYAPAFIVHDWLFTMKHCQIKGHEDYSNEIAASVMAEVMKTMMESGKVSVDKLTLISMHAAVNSSVAENRWNTGVCVPPPAGLATKKKIDEFVISFE